MELHRLGRGVGRIAKRYESRSLAVLEMTMGARSGGYVWGMALGMKMASLVGPKMPG